MSQKFNEIRERTNGICLVAVAKGQSVEKIKEVLKAGQLDFGENYAQEMLEHVEALLAAPFGARQGPIRWHFIGHLQRNKVRLLIDKTTLIHSVDSIPLAHEIDRRAAEADKIQEVLVEINLGGESSKSGIGPVDADALVAEISKLDHLRLKGLMTLPPFSDDPEKSRPYFQKLREIRDAINRRNLYKYPLTELSMGMTHDFEVAIQEGATIVRIGTGIFGAR
jgi:hypothetical protein